MFLGQIGHFTTQTNPVITNYVITNIFLGQIGHFTTQINPVITIPG
jgi:hypothetical protein